MPITQPEHIHDFKLIFKNKSFSISKCLFGLYSNYFKQHPSFLENFLDLTEDGISTDSFEQFVKACQSCFYIINNKNCFELLTLCDKFEVQTIKKEVNLFILNTNDAIFIINKLKSIINQNDENDNDKSNLIGDIEESIAKRINLYLDEQAFVTLPISNLFNIISKSISYSKSKSTTKNKSANVPIAIDNHLFFSFLLSALQYHKESSIALFDLIEDYGQFTQEEINTLMSNSPFSRDIMNSIFISGLSTIETVTNKQMEQINNLRDQIRSIQNDTTEHVNKVEKKVNDLKSDFEIIKSRSNANISASSQSSNGPFSLSITIPSSFSKVTLFESKNDQDMTVNLNPSNTYNFLKEVQSQLDEYQSTLTKNSELMKNFEEKYDTVVTLYNDVNSQFDSILNKLSTAAVQPPESTEKRTQKESSSFSKKKSSNLSVKEQKKENQKAQSVLQKKFTKKENTGNSSSPNFWADLFESSNQITCEYSNSSSNSEPFNGIFNLLSKRISNTSNLYDSCIIDIQASSSTIKNPSLICDSKSNYYWSSANSQKQWVKIDFKNMMIKINHYSIQTISRSQSENHLKNWVLEGTNAIGFSPSQIQKDNPNVKWETIDNRVNDMNLNGLNKFFTYDAKMSDKFFRYIRLKITGPNHSGNFFLALRRIEFFGTIKPFDENEDFITHNSSGKFKIKS